MTMMKYEYTDQDFNFLQGLALREVGITLASNKKDLLYGRLVKRIRELKLSNFRQYCDLLKASNEQEMHFFINAVTTNLTSFFREAHHFVALKEYLLQTLVNNCEGRELKIWSAGCSSGEEPYTIAMTVMETFNNTLPMSISIIGTDIDSNKLDECARGVYSEDSLQSFPSEYYHRYLQRGSGNNVGYFKIKDDIKRLVTFKKMNLINPWDLAGDFDLIFCRNVLIYFDEALQLDLIHRFANKLAPGGYFICGHSESVANKCQQLACLGKTIYRVKP